MAIVPPSRSDLNVTVPSHSRMDDNGQDNGKSDGPVGFLAEVGSQVRVITNRRTGDGHYLDVEKCRLIYHQKIDYDPERDERDMAYYELLLKLERGVKWRGELIQKHGDPLYITKLSQREQEMWKNSIKAPFNSWFADEYGLKAALTIYSTCRYDPKELIASPL